MWRTFFHYSDQIKFIFRTYGKNKWIESYILTFYFASIWNIVCLFDHTNLFICVLLVKSNVITTVSYVWNCILISMHLFFHTQIDQKKKILWWNKTTNRYAVYLRLAWIKMRNMSTHRHSKFGGAIIYTVCIFRAHFFPPEIFAPVKENWISFVISKRWKHITSQWSIKQRLRET